MVINKIVAEELRSIRAIKNVTIVEVSVESGVDKNTISKYENGESNIYLDILCRLLDYYEITIFNFFANINDRMQKSRAKID